MEKLSMPADYDQGVDVSSSPPYAAAATTKKLLSKKATNVLDKIQVLIQDDGTNQHQQRQQLGDGETTTDASSSFSWDRVNN